MKSRRLPVTPKLIAVFGLGYVRTKAGGAGLKVQVGETTGEIVDVPFLTSQPSIKRDGEA